MRGACPPGNLAGVRRRSPPLHPQQHSAQRRGLLPAPLRHRRKDGSVCRSGQQRREPAGGSCLPGCPLAAVSSSTMLWQDLLDASLQSSLSPHPPQRCRRAGLSHLCPHPHTPGTFKLVKYSVDASSGASGAQCCAPAASHTAARDSRCEVLYTPQAGSQSAVVGAQCARAHLSKRLSLSGSAVTVRTGFHYPNLLLLSRSVIAI